MPGPRVGPVQSDEDLSARAHIVVIGGGILGTTAALYLAQRRVSVALCEKDRIAGGAVVPAGAAWSRLFCGNFVSICRS